VILELARFILSLSLSSSSQHTLLTPPYSSPLDGTAELPDCLQNELGVRLLLLLCTSTPHHV
jgi:hypothetical protein